MGSWEALSSCSETCSSPGTWRLETPDNSSPESAGHLEEQWSKPSPPLPLLARKAEPNMDVVLVDSRDLLSPASPPPGRDLIAYEVTINQRNIEELCLCCGSLQVYTQHPLFEGGMCAPCKDKFLETLFLYDDDGYQCYCSICCSGDALFICESPDCTRCYCFECVDTLVGPGTSERIHSMSCWVCFLCLPFSRSGLLQRRRKWRHGLKAFYDLEAISDVGLLGYGDEFMLLKEVLECKPSGNVQNSPCVEERGGAGTDPFGDITKATEFGLLESGSHSEGERLKHLNDVTNIVRRDVEGWGPFDLVYGSTQPLGYSCDHCPGWYLFQFHRVLQYARPHPGSQQPFFWMFVDNLLLTEDDQATAARFLEMEPVTLQDVRGRVLQNAVRVWSNIPGVRSKHTALTAEEELSLQVQVDTRAKLAAQGLAPLVKNCFLPLREYFKYFSQNSLPLYK